MKTLFKSKDLWDLVENGYAEASTYETCQKENQKKDTKALFFIQLLMKQSFLELLQQSHHEMPGTFSKLNIKDQQR